MTTQRFSLTDARRRLIAMVDRALTRGERYTITRHGRAVAALVSVEDLRRIEATDREVARRGGGLALVGLWGDIADAEIDALVEEILVTRDRDSGRSVDRQL